MKQVIGPTPRFDAHHCFVECHDTPVCFDCFSGFIGCLFFASPGVPSRLKLVGLPMLRALRSYLSAASRSVASVPRAVRLPSMLILACHLSAVYRRKGC